MSAWAWVAVWVLGAEPGAATTSTTVTDLAIPEGMPPPVRLAPAARPGPPSPVEPEVAPAPAKVSGGTSSGGRRPPSPSSGRRIRRGGEQRRPSTVRPSTKRRRGSTRKTTEGEARGEEPEQRDVPDAGSGTKNDQPVAVSPDVDMPAGSEREPGIALILLLVALAAWLLLLLVRATRRRALEESPISRALLRIERGLSVLVAFLVFSMALRWLNPGSTALVWGVVAATGIVLWSTRNLLPDLAAGVALRLERAVSPGMVIQPEGERGGTIERVGFRGLTLRDDRGRAWSVPYRVLTRAPFVRSDSELARHQLRVRIAAEPGRHVRRAVEEAVAMSPYVRVGAPLRVERDLIEPRVWTVDVALIDRRYFSAMEGELAERVERVLGEL